VHSLQFDELIHHNFEFYITDALQFTSVDVTKIVSLSKRYLYIHNLNFVLNFGKIITTF
jgi:hypothetical protein